jgi:uncharacterized protein DUF2855
MTTTTAVDMLIDRADLARVELRKTTLDTDTLAAGQALLRVDHFGFTANNITYAALGESMRYWQFFPAPEGWGIIPVWGFAEVQVSRCPGIEARERFYGYYPMSSHLRVEAAQVKKGGFVDAAEHRQSLPFIYNQYLRTSRDPLYTADSEAAQMLLRPLFTTSFLLDDFFADNGFFAARRLVLTSASSKTAIGTAYLLNSERGAREQDYEIIGLTSSGHRAFVEGLGCYDRVLGYEQLADLDAGRSALIVDFAGNGELLGRLHGQLGLQLQYSCLVGVSHWQQRGGLPKDLPGPEPKLFFAPAQAHRRLKDWGGEIFQRRLTKHWQAFSAFAGQWLSIEYGAGPEVVERVYGTVLSGHANPRAGHVLSLLDEG